MSSPITRRCRSESKNGDDRLVLAEACSTTHQNLRRTMEDRLLIVEDLLPTLRSALKLEPHQLPCRVSLFAVFDGHLGARTADFAVEHLVPFFVQSLRAALDAQETLSSARDLADVFHDALAHSICALDEAFLSIAIPQSMKDGACSLVTLLVDNTLIVANTGDCRGILVETGSTRAPLALSSDHTPGRADEHERVLRAGGTVRHSTGCLRCYPYGLAVSRSLGDARLKRPRPILIAEPEMFRVELDPLVHRTILLASDGVWCRMSNNQVRDVARQWTMSQARGAPARKSGDSSSKGPASMADEVCDAAMKAGSSDNIAVIAVHLTGPADAPVLDAPRD